MKYFLIGILVIWAGYIAYTHWTSEKPNEKEPISDPDPPDDPPDDPPANPTTVVDEAEVNLSFLLVKTDGSKDVSIVPKSASISASDSVKVD